MSLDLLQGTRVALAVGMLCGAAVLDLRSRRVANQYWFPFIAAAAVLLVVDIGLRGSAALGFELLAAAVIAGLLYLAFWLRLYGGADAKALMVVAFLAPLPLRDFPPFPLAFDALANGAMLALAYPVVLLAWNLAHGRARLPAAFIGTPMPLAQARAAHVWPMQRMVDGKLTWRYWTRVGMDVEGEYDGLAAAGLGEVWVTAKIPFVALLAAGAVVAVLWGNVLVAAGMALAS